MIFTCTQNGNKTILYQNWDYTRIYITKHKTPPTFTIDCPDYLIQLAADKDLQIPLPIMTITEKD